MDCNDHDTSITAKGEEEVQRTEERFSALVHATSSIVWSRNCEGAFITPQPAWEAYTGQTWDEYKGFGWLQALHPDDRDRIREHWRRVGTQAQEANHRVSFGNVPTRLWSRSHNAYRHSLLRALGLVNAATGKVDEWLGTHLDLTDLYAMEESMVQREKQLLIALEVADASVFVYQLQEDRLQLDNRSGSLFSLPSFTGIPLARLLERVHTDDRERLKTVVQAATPFEVQISLLRPNGSMRVVCMRGDLTLEPGPDRPKELTGLCWDITERHLLAERLRSSERRLELEQSSTREAQAHRARMGEFLDIVVHEMRSPLNAVYGGVALLREELSQLQNIFAKLRVAMSPAVESLIETELERGYAAVQRAINHVDTIDACARQQKEIADDVLDLSRLEGKFLELNEEEFSLQDLIQNALAKQFRAAIEAKKLHCHFNDIPSVRLVADRHRLLQILINLLSNAVKFTPQDGTIAISAWLEDDAQGARHLLKVRVDDSGIGMDELELSKLFRPFSQATKRTSAEHGGSGLGLMICKKLVEAMGGSISARSRKGRGTQMEFTIRCTTPCPSLHAPEATTQQPKKGAVEEPRIEATDNKGRKNVKEAKSPSRLHHVLAAEDNVFNQQILSSYLTSLGCTVEIATNGREAIKRYQTGHFDLIMMDVQMPEMDGLAATRAIRALELSAAGSTHIPIIGLSAGAREEHQIQALEAGMDEYLTKPCRKEDIQQRLLRLLPATNPKIE